MDSFEELIHPIGKNQFFTQYWGKEHFVLKADCGGCTDWMKNLYTWDMFDKYLNMYPDITHLQILDYNGERYCLKKTKTGKEKGPLLSKKEVYDLWKEGKSFVIPTADYQNKDLLKICHEVEKYFGQGSANVYCSPGGGSKSFPIHADNTENFLLHNHGKIKWTIYKEFAPEKPKTIIAEYELEAGDILYIPIGQYHKAESITPRLSTSIHFYNKADQSLKNFKVGYEKRPEWYDFKYFLNEDSNNK